MGRERVTVVHIQADVSRHNSKQDEQDDALVEELHDRIMKIVRQKKYQGIRPDEW